MSKEQIKEFIEDDGTLINSKMPPKVDGMAASKMTTDQHVAASRQGMVWMNYRRFYGESGEVLPYAKEADKWANNPEQFYKFLKTKGEQDKFNQYFVKKTKKKDVQKVLKETSLEKMKKLVEDLVVKKIDIIGDIVRKVNDDKPNIEQLKEKHPALMKKVDAISEEIKQAFTEEEYDIVIDYMTQLINT